MMVPVVLAGGSGTRLWPLSRELYPKQLINLVDERTLLQNTLLRLNGLPDLADPVVVCNEKHRFVVAEQLRTVDIAAAAIFLEPVGRNTAPAVTVAALQAVSGGDDPVLLVLPADHSIGDIAGFHQALETGAAFARKGYLVTFGVIPEGPETGYGYIRKGPEINGAGGSRDNREVFAIDRFVEKPDLETARRYVASGDYCWNSGMFMFTASRLLEEMRQHAPEMVAACERSVSRGRKDMDFFRLDPAAFAACRGDSIDYAVMEKTDKGAMVPFKARWNDLGSWEAMWTEGEKDGCDNVIRGDVMAQDVHHSLLYAGSRLLAAVGLENHIVVETADAVLVAPRDRVQQVKALVSRLKADQRPETRTHRKVYRPWGTTERLDSADNFRVNFITVAAGAVLSLQKHYNRAEHWIVLSGTARVTRGEKAFLLRKDESTFIPSGVPHRLENPGRVPLTLIEVQTGDYLGEDDIVRLEDHYGEKA